MGSAWRLCGGGIAAVSVAAALCAPAHASDRAAGIFFEGRFVGATLRGDDRALPAEAVRCSNCHDGAGHRRVSPAGVASEAGPALTLKQLATPRSRRGGPPSRFEARTFCRLLRTGIDPADIVVRRTMPLYNVSGPDCAALWALLADEGLR